MVLLLSLGCTSTPAETDASGAERDTAEDAAPVELGNCAGYPDGAFAEDAFPWQGWDNGNAAQSLADWKSYKWTGQDGARYNLYKTPGWEAVRFEFDDPTCIYALQVHWAAISEAAPEAIGLYKDFGQNGFDFHPDEPYATMEKELTDEYLDGWTTYVLPAPLELDDTWLIYAASFRDGADGPGLAVDDDFVGEGNCPSWDDCHSVLNYPDADATTYYAGTTYPFPYDFLVRTQFETLSTLAPEDRWFHAASEVPLGSNVAWGDYDDDGDDDLMAGGPALWRNDAGVFTDVSASSLANTWGVGTSGGVWGDYDNDGCLDYYGLGGGNGAGELLLHSNCDGTFSDGTALSTINDLQGERSCLGSGEAEYSPSAGATWTDFDNDGLIDLVQANFLCFDSYTNYPDRFWHNEGGGVFSEWGEDHGFEWDDLAGRGAQSLDADLDGDLDINIVNYVLQRNLYYRNNGDGTFEEVAGDVGLAGKGTAYGQQTYYGHTIGLAWGDLDNDGDWDAVHANLAHPRFYGFSDRTNLLLQEDGHWTDVAAENGIVYHETHSDPSLLDIENDGDLDLFITEVYGGRPTDVYVNGGPAMYTEMRRQAGITTEGGWGAAVSDYDGDGDQDYLESLLFRNDGPSGHWLELRLVGDVMSNYSAIGGLAWVTAGGKTTMASVNGGTGTGCQDSQTLHFGLGDATTIEAVRVWFPGGATVEYSGLAVDSGWRLTESGTATAGLGR